MATNGTAKTKTYTKCKRCGYVYAAPWKQDHCSSDTACARRKAINAAERKAGLPVTAWTMHGRELTSAMAAARKAIDAAAAATAPAA
jgi:hypothetical protein